MTTKELYNNRYKSNLKILDKILDFCTEHPEQRFIQALWSLGVITRQNVEGVIHGIEDKFYEESWETLDKINSMLSNEERRTEEV